MNWLARLKNKKTPDTYATKPTKPPHGQGEPGFVGFVASLPGGLEKLGGATVDPAMYAANDPKPPAAPEQQQAQAVPADPDRWNWPASPAMNRAELDCMLQRLALFDDRGLSVPEAEAVADLLVQRDRTGDRRGSCAECRRLAGHGPTGWRCTDRTHGNELAGARLARDWLVQLHHCPGHAIQFTEH